MDVTIEGNEGDFLRLQADTLWLKSEAFVHFTWVKSKQRFTVIDIQGVLLADGSFALADPEICSVEHFSKATSTKTSTSKY